MIKTLLVLIAIVVVGGMAYVMVGQNSRISQPATTPVPSKSSSTSETVDEGVNTVEGDLKAGGSSFLDPKGVFVVLYPNDYVLDTQDSQHIRIYKTGETQRGQTEMYDGVLMVFESVDLQGKTLEQWVDATIQTSTADGTLKITQPKKAITVNGYPGFTYTARGLGEATYLVLQKSPGSQFAVNITTSVSDPQQKNYQAQVDAVVASLELLK